MALNVVKSITPECGGSMLKNKLKPHLLKPHLKELWVIPPEKNAVFVATMEDILEVYQRPYNENWPVVCLDELSKRLMKETGVPVPTKPGQPAR